MELQVTDCLKCRSHLTTCGWMAAAAAGCSMDGMDVTVVACVAATCCRSSHLELFTFPTNRMRDQDFSK